jgi:hypothetical protein
MMAHFPRRDSSKDAVVASDIAAEVVAREIGLVAVYSVCKDVWQSATDEKPFIRPSGQIIGDMQEKNNLYKKWKDGAELLKIEAKQEKKEPEKRESDPFNGKKWDEFTDEEKQAFVDMYGGAFSTIQKIMIKAYSAPDSVFNKVDDDDNQANQ